ncbi:hypothetical protein [Klebsiella grimontii]|uniref:hypothetical protein n=1 Tax=Klebsiella grimontii TaxID=2058152 RepID=UPI001E288562|nr:hypothetical protein [Klebsiella grimontii]
MTSKLTREERVQALYDLKVGQVLSLADIENVKMLSRMALAAMDSEPVGYFGRFDPDDEDLIDQCSKNVKGAFPLYRHAQQPVVPDERAAFNAWNNEDNLPIAGVGAKNAAWLAWQARAELAGNSPAIQDGYVMVPKEPTKEMIDAGWLYYMGTKNPSSKGTYKAMLAATPQEVPDGK